MHAAQIFNFRFSETSFFKPISAGGLISDDVFIEFQGTYGVRKVQSVIVETERKYPDNKFTRRTKPVGNPGGLLRVALRNHDMWLGEKKIKEEKAMIKLGEAREKMSYSEKTCQNQDEIQRKKDEEFHNEYVRYVQKHPKLFSIVSKNLRLAKPHLVENKEVFAGVLQTKFVSAVQELYQSDEVKPSQSEKPKPWILTKKSTELGTISDQEWEESNA